MSLRFIATCTFVPLVIDCLDPPVVGNATRIASGSTYGSVVVFTCPRGYFMGRTGEATFEGSRVSTATIHCQADALWSDEPDNCQSISIILTLRKFAMDGDILLNIMTFSRALQSAVNMERHGHQHVDYILRFQPAVRLRIGFRVRRSKQWSLVVL